MSRGENEELLTPSPAPIDAAEADAISPCSITESPSSDSGSFNLSAPPELRAMWADPPSDDVPVRGPTYMDDQVKVPAGPSVATLLHFDLWTTSTPEKRHHAARFDTQRGPNSVIRTCAARHPDALVFVLNIMLPDSNNVSLVSYWLVPKYMDDSQQDPFYTLLRRFCDPVDGDSADFRDRRFKMIPSFTQAPWIINSLVQSRPALTGQKLTQTYYRQDNYIEVDMDISSSTIAHYIGSLCQSWATYIEVDVFVTVQGEEEHELPEKILGGVRLTYVDLSLAQPVDDEDVVEEDDDTTDE